MLQLARQSEFDAPRVRRMTREDAPWALALATRRYPQFDVFAAAHWLDQWIDSRDMCFMRSEHAACVACIVSKFWAPQVKEAHLMFLLAEDNHAWDAVRALRAVIQWAAQAGAEIFEMSSDTGFDVSRLARRFGKTRTVTAHVLEL